MPVPWCPREGQLATPPMASLVECFLNCCHLLMFVEHTCGG